MAKIRRPVKPVQLGLALLISAFGTVWPAFAGDYLVTPITVETQKSVFGRVESRETSAARARLGGTVVTLTVEAGSAVTAGQVIARVEDRKLALELDAADAKVKALQAELANARDELDRGQALVARGVATQQRVDQLRTQVDVLTSQIAAAGADRAVIVQRASEGEVLAPKTGRVIEVPVTLDSVVIAGEPIARIASGGYFLRLAVPERHAATIKPGDSVRVGLRGLDPVAASPAAVHSGKVVKVYPELSGGRVIADVEVEGLGDFFVGERIPVWIPIGTRPVLAIPIGAVATRSGLDLVRVVAEGGTQEIAVVLGQPVDLPTGSGIEILTGLKDGDHVVSP